MEDPLLNFPADPSTQTHPEPPPQAYPPAGINSKVPIVIDFGSHEIRAGWAGSHNPSVALRSLTCKARDWSGEMVTVAGNQVMCRDITKNTIRSPFEKDVLQHFECAETLLDYTLYRLGINTDTLNHPVLMTEALCNPNTCRALTSEILFECYGAPSVCYGVDALFAYDYHTHPSPSSPQAPWTDSAANGLSLHLGHSSCYIVPISNGCAQLQHAYRLSLGGYNCTNFLVQTLPLRFPLHRQAFSIARAQYIKENYCHCAEEHYGDELRKFEVLSTCQDKLRRFQLPYTEKEVPTLTEEDLERRKKQRQEAADRLREMARAKRERQLAMLREAVRTLQGYQGMAKSAKGKELAALNEKLQGMGVADAKALPKALLSKVKQLAEVKARHMEKGYQVDEDDDVQVDVKMLVEEQQSYPLVDIPDSQLTPEQRDEKRKQKMLRGAALARQAERERKEKDKAEKERQRLEHERERMKDPVKWLTVAKARRAELLERRETRKKVKVQQSDRRGEAAQERMKAIISTLAGAEDKRKGEDGCADDGSDFGEEDEDWDVYRTIAKNDDSEDEDEDEERLAELDAQIMEVDASHVPAAQLVSADGKDTAGQPPALTKEDFQICLGTELMQAPEILFSPCILGLDCCGLAELLSHVLSRFPPSQRMQMASNIVISGGSSNIHGVVKRLQYELKAVLPFESPLVVRHSDDDATLDAWRGASRFAASAQGGTCWVSKKDYEEMGAAYLKEHRCANKYLDTLGRTDA